jgi:hypothetical protein
MASDAERLAWEQSLTGVVGASESIRLRGKYWVSYRLGESLHAAVATVEHEG